MGSTKTLADFLKESAWSNNVSANNSSPTTSMPWATAVKTHPDHHNQQQQHQHHHHHQQQQQQQQHGSNSFDYGGTIGSWTSPETSSSTRGGWNADGSSKNEPAFDDGTAIWGNPAMNKTGVDWIEKESLLNPPKVAQSSTSNNNSSSSISSNSIEKKIQKPGPAASSINGTEAWGGPIRAPTNSQAASISTKNEISSNDVFSTKPIRDQTSFGWGSEPFNIHETTDDNSSPPSNVVWNNMGFGNSTDWLSSPSSTASSRLTGLGSIGSRIDELNKQLESTSLFDLVPTMTSKHSGSGNLNLNQHPIGIGLLGSGGGGLLNTGNGCSGDVRPVGAHNMNDLKQMSANYSSNLLDLQNRPTGGLQASNNQQSQQLDSSAFSTAANPSRELLKQMVHQIQLAVQAGHLNAHILNQPMSTPTLQLVYQLLQQIKTLHQLQEIQQRAGITSDLGSRSNIDIQINRIKQSISTLQKAITQQQATSSTGSSTAGAAPSSAWSAFGCDFISQQAWPNSQLRISSNASQHHEPHQYSAFDHIVSSDYGLQFNVDNNKQQHIHHNQAAQLSSGPVGARPAPPPGLLSEYSPFVGGGGSDAFSINVERRF